jgi:hypothetical protein
MSSDSYYRTAVNDFRRKLIADTVAKHGGNKSQAAAELGVLRTRFQRMCVELHVELPASECVWGRHGCQCKSDGGMCKGRRAARALAEASFKAGRPRRKTRKGPEVTA